MRPAWRKAIAALEVAGGVCGPAFFGADLARGRVGPGGVVLTAGLMLVYLLALAAGIHLWYGTRAGRVLSVAAQLLQLPKVFSPALTYGVGYGMDVTAAAMASDGPAGYGLVFDVRFLASHRLLVDVVGAPTGVGVSLTSVVALWLLLRPPGARRIVEPTPPVVAGATDEQPEWVPSFGLLLVGLVAVGVVTACCGFPMLVKLVR